MVLDDNRLKTSLDKASFLKCFSCLSLTCHFLDSVLPGNANDNRESDDHIERRSYLSLTAAAEGNLIILT